MRRLAVLGAASLVVLLLVVFARPQAAPRASASGPSAAPAATVQPVAQAPEAAAQSPAAPASAIATRQTVASPATAARSRASKPAPARSVAPNAAANPAEAAMSVERDESGALVPARTRALPGSAAVEALRSREVEPIETRRADGAVIREYPNGLLEYAVIRRTPDGRHVQACVQGAPPSPARLDSIPAPVWEVQ
jgi:hypothetical protein